MRRVVIAKDELEELYSGRQFSLRDLCRHYHHDAKTILKVLKRHGIKLRSGREAWVVQRRLKTLPQVSCDRLRALYADRNKTSYSLAVELGIPARTIRRYLHLYGIAPKMHCPTYDTSIERRVEDELAAREIGHYKQYRIGRICLADKAFPDERIAVFCDGGYWHSLERVIIKDAQVDARLIDLGWVVLRFSEHQINTNVKAVVDTLQAILERRRNLLWAHVPENGKKRDT